MRVVLAIAVSFGLAACGPVYQYDIINKCLALCKEGEADCIRACRELLMGKECK